MQSSKKKKKAKDLEKVFKEKEKSASWGCLGADFFAHLRGHEGDGCIKILPKVGYV